MKAEKTIVIMSLLGTLSGAAKLLKVPRIYNAVITSDQNLLPSQTYPALTPVIQSIHYPVPSYVYKAVIPISYPPNVQYTAPNQAASSQTEQPIVDCDILRSYENSESTNNNTNAENQYANNQQYDNQYAEVPGISSYSNMILDFGYKLEPENNNEKESTTSDKEYLPTKGILDSDLIKNNKPKDPSIVDVPPPPLPVGKHKDGQAKKPEEYPPPPLGFIF